MRTIRIKLYKFSELSKDAKQTAIEKLYDLNTDNDWWDYIYEDATEIGKLMGIDIDKIYFSGFSSQGDGACFEGSYSYNKDSVNKVKEYAPTDERLHSIAQRLYEIQKENFYKLNASVKQSGHYSHEYCTSIEVYKGDDYASDKTEEEVKDILRDYMRWIYRNLEKEYDYLTSEPAIIETIEANEYEFTKDGKLN